MTTEQWERENQDPKPQILQLPDLRPQDAESAEKP